LWRFTETAVVCSQKLQRQLEFLAVQEEYIKDEQRNLKKEYLHAQEEVKRIQSVPLVIGQFLEAVDQNTGIVGSTTGERWGRARGGICARFLLISLVHSFIHTSAQILQQFWIKNIININTKQTPWPLVRKRTILTDDRHL
jgi:hypothetical protein